MKKVSKKKVAIIVIVILAVAAVAAALVWYFFLRSTGTSEEVTYYEATGDYSTSYYSGIVEPEESVEITRDSSREINEVYVSVGDQVSVGQQLFSYKTDDLSLQLQQAQIELEDYDAQIASAQRQIDQLNTEKASAPTEQQLEYTSQIQEQESAKKQAQLSKKTKQAEIENLQKQISASVITSTIDGTIRSINDTATEGTYMTILSTGAYRIKGSVDELNYYMLSEGQSVIIHSRVDESKTWEGTITKMENGGDSTSSESTDYISDSSSSVEVATKYNFYVALTTSDDLLIGQHVYIEPVYDDSDETYDDSSVVMDEEGNIIYDDSTEVPVEDSSEDEATDESSEDASEEATE